MLPFAAIISTCNLCFEKLLQSKGHMQHSFTTTAVIDEPCKDSFSLTLIDSEISPNVAIAEVIQNYLEVQQFYSCSNRSLPSE